MPEPAEKVEYANELNVFYSRFDKYDFSDECLSALKVGKDRNDDQITVEELDVLLSLKNLKTNKVCGPDNLFFGVLKVC